MDDATSAAAMMAGYTNDISKPISYHSCGTAGNAASF